MPGRPVNWARRGWGSGIWAAAAAAALALGGCTTVQDAPAPAAPPPLQLQVQAPDELKRLLERDLDLARLPALAAGRTLPPREVERLVAAAPEQVRALAATEGWFTPDVQVQSAGGDPPLVRVVVEPGPRTRVGGVTLDVQGDGGAPARRALSEGWPLPPGAPFRNPAWSSAKAAALARVRAEGWAVADWAQTEARVDAAAARAELTAIADTGPLFRTGEIRVRGLAAHDERTVQNLVDLAPGRVATERALLDAQERLQKSGLFDIASVRLETEGTDPAAAPLTVRLRERALQEATVGLGISTDVGVRGTVEHVHRRAFGRAATMRNRVELGGVRQAWEGEVSSHTLPGLNRNLVGGAAERIESDTDVISSLRVRAGRARDEPRAERLAFVELERSLRRTDTMTQRSDALSAHVFTVLRRVDDLMLPTRGWIGTLQTGAGHARTDPGGRGPFGRVYARVNGYRPLGAWYGQLRLELGQVFSREDVVPPESLLFRAGGDASVRGYGYRKLTPTVNGVETGGKVLATASVELARPILARLPALWGAVFVDAGRAERRWADYTPALGAGVGLRYRSPIGPVNLDIAYGEEVRRWRLHLGVGVTF